MIRLNLKIPKNFERLILQDRFWVLHIPLVRIVKFQFLQWITLPTQSCLVFYSFWANLLPSLIMWLIVSSISPHNLHLLFCYIFSILALLWLVLIEFYAAIRRDSISLLRFPSLSHIQVFTSEISLDYYYNYYSSFSHMRYWLSFTGILVTLNLCKFSGFFSVL